jgi:hypothetical protein
LNYFKSDSLSITFAWNCQLVLYLENQTRFNSNLITQELQNPEFTPISLAFDRIDRRYEPQCKLLECRNFQFDSPSDGDVSEHMLPWYAGNKTKEFADQIIKKVERFTQNDEVTKLIYKLNEIALIKPDQ